MWSRDHLPRIDKLYKKWSEHNRVVYVCVEYIRGDLMSSYSKTLLGSMQYALFTIKYRSLKLDCIYQFIVELGTY